MKALRFGTKLPFLEVSGSGSQEEIRMLKYSDHSSEGP